MMETLGECKWLYYTRHIFSPKNKRREVWQRQHAKPGTILKVSGGVWGFGWGMLLFPAFSQDNLIDPKNKAAFKSTFPHFLHQHYLSPPDNASFKMVSVYTTLHERMPSSCRPDRLKCGLQRANVKIPPSSLLNTGVNNSAQPEQRVNLRERWALWCVLHFLSPSHMREPWRGHFHLCSWLRGVFLLHFELPGLIFTKQPELLPRVDSWQESCSTPACHPRHDLWGVLHDNTSQGGVEGGQPKRHTW